MNTLFEKISALVEINVRSLIGQTNRTKNAASFFRHYMEVEQNLIEVERLIARSEAQMQSVVQKGRQSEEQLRVLDRRVDDLLIQGDEAGAREGQRLLNKAKRINIGYRAQIQDLNREREKLLRIKEKLEVQLDLMQEEKERLQELYRQYQADHQGTHNGNVDEKVYWVVEED